MNKYLKVYVVKSIRTILRILHIFPVNNRRILFSAYEGQQYTCNPKYIFESMFEQNPDNYEYIWVLNNPDNLPKEYHCKIKLVRHLSFNHIFYLSTSKFIISNLGIEPIIPIRKKQIFINTWHGGGAYKRVSADMNMFSDAERYYINSMKAIRRKGTSYFLSSCKKFSVISSVDFAIDYNKFIPTGLPRNDLFFHRSSVEISKLRTIFCKEHSIPDDNLIVLYAPTFRGNHRKQEDIDNQVCCMEINDALMHRFNKNVTFLFRSHISKNSKNKAIDNKDVDIVNMTEYPDMQQLLLYSDVLITDYSSSIWDFCITYKPGFLFVPDLIKYNSDRGFYTPIADWPFPYAENRQQLINHIKSYDAETNKSKIDRHREMLGSYETGNATKEVVKLITESI